MWLVHRHNQKSYQTSTYKNNFSKAKTKAKMVKAKSFLGRSWSHQNTASPSLTVFGEAQALLKRTLGKLQCIGPNPVLYNDVMSLIEMVAMYRTMGWVYKWDLEEGVVKRVEEKLLFML